MCSSVAARARAPRRRNANCCAVGPSTLRVNEAAPPSRKPPESTRRAGCHRIQQTVPPDLAAVVRDHHMRRTPSRSKGDSLDIRTRSCASACAMSIRSNGSRCGPRKLPARTASETVMGNSAKPSPAMAPAMSLASAAAPGILPRRYLVAISQADAALISFSLASSAMAPRAATGSWSLPASHHMNAWVSSSSRKTQFSQTESSVSGSGSKKLSSITIRSFHEPNCGFPRGW